MKFIPPDDAPPPDEQCAGQFAMGTYRGMIYIRFYRAVDALTMDPQSARALADKLNEFANKLES